MRPLTVSLIQTATCWHDPAANRDRFDRWFAEVPAEADLVVLPEMFATGFTMAPAEVAEPMDGATMTWLRAAASRLGKTVCGSLVIAEDGRHFNRFVWATPAGTVATYDKRHRFRMAGEHQHYAAGDRRCVVEAGGWRILLGVCYDLRFPVWLRNRNDYDALLVVANWPAARQAAWNALLRARAIENQAYAIGVNIVGRDGNGVEYTGGSAVYDPEARALIEAGDAEGLFTTVLDGAWLADYRRRFPAWQDADDFSLS